MTEPYDVNDAASPAAPPPLPATVLPYQTPLQFGQLPQQGVWRDGMKLVTTRQAVLPEMCIKCGGEANGSYGIRTYYWHHPLLALLILPGLLIYAIVAMAVRKKAVLRVGLCRAHQSRRTVLLTATWFLVLGGLTSMIAGIVSGAAYKNNVFVWVGVIGGLILIIASIITGYRSRILVPTKIDDVYAWFKGCDNSFLETLPPVR